MQPSKFISLPFLGIYKKKGTTIKLNHCVLCGAMRTCWLKCVGYEVFADRKKLQ